MTTPLPAPRGFRRFHPHARASLGVVAVALASATAACSAASDDGATIAEDVRGCHGHGASSCDAGGLGDVAVATDAGTGTGTGADATTDAASASDGGAIDPRGAVFQAKNFVYGAQIGAWEMNGGVEVNDATARANIVAARIPVIRWQMWRPPCDLRATNCQTTADFDAGIDGIRALGAEPLIGLPPIWDPQCTGGADPWSYAWQQWIVRTAGSRVRLYEMANEPDNYCNMSGQQYHDELWVNVPNLKKYARALGLEIHVGGPAWANSYSGDLASIETWLSATKSDYLSHGGDRDWIPDFVSTHTYLVTPSENDTQAHAQARIDAWGAFYDGLRSYIGSTFAGLADRGYPIANEIVLADSEYNDTIDHTWTGNDSQAWTDFYFGAMFSMFKQHRLWAGVEFTIASENGDPLDLLHADGTPMPEYYSFKNGSTTDPNNP